MTDSLATVFRDTIQESTAGKLIAAFAKDNYGPHARPETEMTINDLASALVEAVQQQQTETLVVQAAQFLEQMMLLGNDDPSLTLEQLFYGLKAANLVLIDGANNV